jgi:hypothetical protein
MRSVSGTCWWLLITIVPLVCGIVLIGVVVRMHVTYLSDMDTLHTVYVLNDSAIEQALIWISEGRCHPGYRAPTITTNVCGASVGRLRQYLDDGYSNFTAEYSSAHPINYNNLIEFAFHFAKIRRLFLKEQLPILYSKLMPIPEVTPPSQ